MILGREVVVDARRHFGSTGRNTCHHIKNVLLKKHNTNKYKDYTKIYI